jgi:hypothetical protein
LLRDNGFQAADALAGRQPENVWLMKIAVSFILINGIFDGRNRDEEYFGFDIGSADAGSLRQHGGVWQYASLWRA